MCIAKIINILYLSIKLRNIAKYFIVWCKCGAKSFKLHDGLYRFCNMASVTAFIRVSRKRIDRANVRFRLRDGRNIQLYHASELEINHFRLGCYPTGD